ncbi:MaoC/PaaZ C-terminal domain-containing protein [Rhodoligotrophos ferricapiens]|uniref:MaoC/PaaZ C-terminal domain-containing protein n=1 Tax=Rhodoligotrophos ferricapiens TaxID=3069264 RepID=UPI00315D58AD
MKLAYDEIIAFPIPRAEHAISTRELLHYALALGAGNDLPNPEALPFVYEKGLRPLATYYTILTWLNPRWLTSLGIDVTGLIHVGESLEVHEPIPINGAAVVDARIVAVIDKGAERGAIFTAEFTIRDKRSGRPLATARSDLFCRKDGGIEGAPVTPPASWRKAPDRTPDGYLTLPTRPEQAALYRLCGDMNPIHIDPDVARAAGFDRPLLHGLATYGMAYLGLLRSRLNGETEAMKTLSVRFSGPVFPGETMDLAYWENPHEIDFRISVGANRPVLDGRLSRRTRPTAATSCQEQATV